jgi:hypothetical protein
MIMHKNSFFIHAEGFNTPPLGAVKKVLNPDCNSLLKTTIPRCLRRPWLIIAAAIFLVACAASPRETESPPPEAGVLPAPVPAKDPFGPAFKNLPPEARDYLERLAEAFSAGDEAFLLAQGEPQFEAELKPNQDKESYLALLYRTGIYALESPRLDAGQPRLVLAGISRIEYLAWKESGPLLEIQARLVGRNGKNTPCRIMLVWRLREPKIEGLFL